MKVMEEAQKNMKKQFNRKRRNSQELKVGDNMQLENKNIYLNRPSKKLDQKRYRPFRILKDIGLGAFQLELLEGQIIHNMFNKDLLTRCNKPQFKGQYVELAPLLTIINEEEEYELKDVVATTRHKVQQLHKQVKLLVGNQVGKITREFNKEPLLYQSPIYTKCSWSVLPIINPALMSMLHSHVHLISYSRLPYCIHML